MFVFCDKILIPVNELKIALEICQKYEYVDYLGSYFLPIRGITMGPSHACDVMDIWISNIAKKCNDNISIPHTCFQVYRDAGRDIIMDKTHMNVYNEIIQKVHKNLK